MVELRLCHNLVPPPHLAPVSVFVLHRRKGPSHLAVSSQNAKVKDGKETDGQRTGTYRH